MKIYKIEGQVSVVRKRPPVYNAEGVCVHPGCPDSTHTETKTIFVAAPSAEIAIGALNQRYGKIEIESLKDVSTYRDVVIVIGEEEVPEMEKGTSE